MQQLKNYVHHQVDAGKFATTVDCYQWIAEQLGLKCHSSVRQWACGTRPVLPKHARGLEQITGVPKYISCPDIFDAP